MIDSINKNSSSTYYVTELQKRYLDDIRPHVTKKFNRTTKKQAKEVDAMVVEYQKTKCLRLREYIVVSQVKLVYQQVVKFINKYKVNSVNWSIDDVVADANLILLNMIENYDVSKTATFSTYVRNTLNFYLLNKYKEVGQLIRMPSNHIQKIIEYRKKYERYMDIHGEAPPDKTEVDVDGSKYFFDSDLECYLDDVETAKYKDSGIDLDDVWSSSIDDLLQGYPKRVREILHHKIVGNRTFSDINFLLTPNSYEESKACKIGSTTNFSFDGVEFEVLFDINAPKKTHFTIAETKFKTSSSEIILTLDYKLADEEKTDLKFKGKTKDKYKYSIRLKKRGVFKRSTEVKNIYEAVIHELRLKNYGSR